MTARTDELVIATHKPDPTGKNPRGIFWNRGSYDDLDKAVAELQQWDAEANTTVYFGVGTFKDHYGTNAVGKLKLQRKQEQATFFKALALDLDIGADKPYATQKEGWAALRAAVEAIGLPPPMVVSSGNGIHVYWPLQQEVPKENWVRISTALRMALQSHNVTIDTSKIHDPSMVLRPVGTHHKKQVPWKEVRCVMDCPDYDVVELASALKPWASMVPATHKPSRAAGKPASSIAAAVLSSNDVILESVLPHCEQLRAIAESGGVSDARGRPVEEPLWRLTLGMAKHCTDPQQAIIMLAGKHPEFDLDDSMSKMSGWHGSGPATCAAFDRLCSNVCSGCSQNGKIKSPAQLSRATEMVVEVPSVGEVPIVLPKGYVIQGDKLMKEVRTDTTITAPDGSEVASEHVELEHVSDYLMHITGVYEDRETHESAFKLIVKYPHEGWIEKAHSMAELASTGKDFSKFLLHRQIYVKTIGQQERLRGFLMDYLSMVQKQAPTGRDFAAFGWQEDGSFLCGERLVGTPTGTVDRRLKGPAQQYAALVCTTGTRDGWVDAMRMLNAPGTDTIRSAILIAMSGLIGEPAGNSTMVLSIYSTKSATGKSLSLAAANSLIGSPRGLFLNQKDTHNALYKIRGVLNHLPCTIDELTAADDGDMTDLVYHLGQGREKTRMTKDADLRKPAVWRGPTLVTTNISLYQKFDAHQAQNEGPRARTLELHHHDRSFVEVNEEGYSPSDRFFRAIDANNGWAMPELAEAVLALGGPAEVWERGERAFAKRFGFTFDPQERYFRTGIVAGWIVAKIGERLGLIPFDVDATTQYLLDTVVRVRKDQEENRQDVFDIIGQYLQENNDKLIECSEEYGSGKEVVRQPAPETAVARIKVVYDKTTPVLPGSVIAINSGAFKKWLARTKDGIDRVSYELQEAGALISSRERVTMFKGVKDRNPGQAHCLIINANHPRFAQALTGSTARPQSPTALAILTGKTA